MQWLSDPQIGASLLTLTVMEIVLGIDNLIFLAILAGRLPAHQQASGRRIGLSVALLVRLGLLGAISWVMRLTWPVIQFSGLSLSWRDLVLIGGGLFLVYKGTGEIHHRIEGEEPTSDAAAGQAGFVATLAQIVALDVVFSLDSVITAVGMANELWIMMTAVIIAMLIMMLAAGPVARFVERHPTVRMLALSFLLLIGMTLIADGFGAHVPKGYIYAAMGFSALVEGLNQLAARSRHSARSRRSAVAATKPGQGGD
jgi:predicted tellurium resistance membrane protein TerC